MSGSERLETGWLPDTPTGDTLVRRFLFNQAEVNAALARAQGGRIERSDAVAMSDTGGPIPFFNQAVLLRPLSGRDDPVLAAVEGFFDGAPAHTLLSLWPTPDLSARGWTLMGHPAFVARGPFPFTTVAAPGVEVRVVETDDDRAHLERIFVDGYPMDMARGLPPGAVFPPGLVAAGVVARLGCFEGEPVAAGLSYAAQGVMNLCGAATLPAARRRGVWEALVWARVADAPDLAAVAYTSDYSRPGFERMGFLPTIRFTLWARG